MDTNENPAAPAQISEPFVPTAPAAPPPAAHLVVHGTKTEREIELERQLEETQREKRAREIRVSELERDVEELKKIPAPRPPRVRRLGPIPIMDFDYPEDAARN